VKEFRFRVLLPTDHIQKLHYYVDNSKFRCNDIINVFNLAGTAINPCGTYGFGETEDYDINIVVPAPACSGAPAPGNTHSKFVGAGTTAFHTFITK
jgi:hypothetical protein